MLSRVHILYSRLPGHPNLTAPAIPWYIPSICRVYVGDARVITRVHDGYIVLPNVPAVHWGMLRRVPILGYPSTKTDYGPGYMPSIYWQYRGVNTLPDTKHNLLKRPLFRMSKCACLRQFARSEEGEGVLLVYIYIFTHSGICMYSSVSMYMDAFFFFLVEGDSRYI